VKTEIYAFCQQIKKNEHRVMEKTYLSFRRRASLPKIFNA